ncbi:hypothetical protein B484DRAFT_462036, partial [Ochromonadaceae sp. CCMP2298]
VLVEGGIEEAQGVAVARRIEGVGCGSIATEAAIAGELLSRREVLANLQMQRRLRLHGLVDCLPAHARLHPPEEAAGVDYAQRLDRVAALLLAEVTLLLVHVGGPFIHHFGDVHHADRVGEDACALSGQLLSLLLLWPLKLVVQAFDDGVEDVGQIIVQTGLFPASRELLLSECVTSNQPVEAPVQPIGGVQLAPAGVASAAARALDPGDQVLGKDIKLPHVQGGLRLDVAAVGIRAHLGNHVHGIQRNLRRPEDRH